MSVANLVTLGRLPVLFLYLAWLFSGSYSWRLAAVGLLVVLFLMDWLDGLIARWRGEVTVLGSALDVAMDRAVENILWVVFVHLGSAPLWVAILFLIRSFIVDGLRGTVLRQGKSVFEMMHSPVGRFLVASRFMRAFYGLAKAWVFCQLTLTWALILVRPAGMPALELANKLLIYLVAGLCLIRGVPVLLDSRIYLNRPHF